MKSYIGLYVYLYLYSRSLSLPLPLSTFLFPVPPWGLLYPSPLNPARGSGAVA